MRPPVVLHISLRDLAPEILLRSQNMVDDVEHVMKANTAPHLAEQQTGNRSFVTGTLAENHARTSIGGSEPSDHFSPPSAWGYSTWRSANGCTTRRSPPAGT